jgi:hypothetical protein
MALRRSLSSRPPSAPAVSGGPSFGDTEAHTSVPAGPKPSGKGASPVGNTKGRSNPTGGAPTSRQAPTSALAALAAHQLSQGGGTGAPRPSAVAHLGEQGRSLGAGVRPPHMGGPTRRPFGGGRG